MNSQNLLAFIEKKYPISVRALTDRFKCDKADKYTLLIKELNKLEDEYLIARNYKDEYLPFAKSDYLIGKIKINSAGHGYIDTEERSYFINQVDLLDALNDDKVLIKIETANEAKVIKVLDHAHHKLVLEVSDTTMGTEYNSINRSINRKLTVKDPRKLRPLDGCYVESVITNYYPQLEVELVKIIGHKNDPGSDITAILSDYEFSLEFPAGALKEADRLTEEISQEDLSGRTDNRDLLTITIDGEDAKDFDDAISLKREENGYRVYVHIADVSSYVKAGSELDKEAYRRSSSIYMVDRVVPMLPFRISNGICSLNPKKLRLTITCEFYIDQKGEILDFAIYPSYIESDERMTYENVNRILEGDEELTSKYSYLVDLLFAMAESSRIIRAKREKGGALDFDKNEAKFIVNDKQEIVDIVARERGKAEMMIEDFMIYANIVVAEQLNLWDIPTIYRIHEDPQVNKIKEFLLFIRNLNIHYTQGKKALTPKVLQEILKQAEDTPYREILGDMLLRSMSKARYSENCSGHFGLAEAEYLHFTSPIRRYSDLIVHRSLHKYLFKKNYDVEEINADKLRAAEIADYISIQERKIMAAEYEVEDMKKAEYMLKYQNRPVDGIISSVTKYGFYVQLPNTVEGLVHISTLVGYYDFDPQRYCLINRQTQKKYQPGQSVKCLVKYVNKDEKCIEFEMIEEARRKRNYGKNNRR